ncbi:MAG: phosphoribosylamine--glycine ligase [Methylobacteriaceae bacterium]|nr:phosphoribosylamine--glycine ligase [Methylobacteriaceae bacterium]
MKVLILGSGGREHALANAVSQSPDLSRLFVAPGNPGMAQIATLAPLDIADHAAVAAFARAEGIDLVIVGPEAPLVAGIVDDLALVGVRAFGPGREAARLEGSKGFTKEICREAGIPTAAWGRFRLPEAALAYVRAQGAPIVVKADGLAAGKGVVVAHTLAEAEAALDQMFGGAFGAAGSSVVIEEMLVGEEVSFFALCDGERAAALGSAQDHKRALDGDRGPNTGGMGAYSPAPAMTPDIEAQVMARIIRPALAAMAARGTPFRGILFAGLMLTAAGPKLIEFNVRFGDPETQALLPRIQDDLLHMLRAAADGQLPNAAVRLSPETALTVVMAAKGYPESPEKGAAIRGLERAAAVEGVTITQAGTALKNNLLVAAGGRVLNVTARASSVAEAQRRAYQAVGLIEAPGLFCRRDIGWRAVERERAAG